MYLLSAAYTKITGLLTNTAIAATNWADWHYRVYFQELSGGIRESRHDSGRWTGGDSQSVICKAKLHSPLAAINSREGGLVSTYLLLPPANSIINCTHRPKCFLDDIYRFMSFTLMIKTSSSNTLGKMENGTLER